MMLKIEGALIFCIVVVLAKTCLEEEEEEFTPKVRRTSYNFTSGENSRSPRKLLDILKDKFSY